MIDSNTRVILDRIAQAVVAREISQIELSKATGVHQSQISRILSGNLQRASKNVLRLCNFYLLHSSRNRSIATSPIEPDMHETLRQLITGHKGSDAALLQVLESLVLWQKALVTRE